MQCRFPFSILRARVARKWALLCASAGLFANASLAETTSPPAATLVVDGQLAEGAGQVRVPASHKAVSFRLAPSHQDDGEGSRRVRFRLSGVDSGWRQMSSEMSLMVRFTDAAGDQVGQRIFAVDGISDGWRGTIEHSTFTARREAVRVPAGGSRLTLAISSSGPPTALGVYEVRALKIFRGGSGAPALLFDSDTSGLIESTQGWRRSGTHPSMASIVRADGKDALCILDDDPNAHAEWNLSPAAAPAVTPGEVLTVEWAELYNIGTGSRFEVGYGHLGAGAYRFLTAELDASGQPSGPERQLDFIVLEPLWKSPWAWLGGGVPLALLVWFGGRALIETRVRRRLARVEQEHMVERERLRIARDLHDDLGARLTHISLVSGLAEKDAPDEAARASFQRVSEMARELVAALYQTVWTVNPEHDHLDSLVNYISQLTQNLCESAGLRCRIHACEVPSERRVTSETRHHVIMAVKEALHNAVKHARAAEITVRVEFADPRLRIALSDDGGGFDPGAQPAGHGRGNMERRMALVGGTIHLESSPGAGTRVIFEVPVPAVSLSP